MVNRKGSIRMTAKGLGTKTIEARDVGRFIIEGSINEGDQIVHRHFDTPEIVVEVDGFHTAIALCPLGEDNNNPLRINKTVHGRFGGGYAEMYEKGCGEYYESLRVLKKFQGEQKK